MANILGSLLVELGLNSAAFVEGMDKATYKAKQGAKEIADGFRGIGENLEGLFSQFGAFGESIGGVFSQIGSGLSQMASELGSAGGAMGVLSVTTAAAAAALTAVAGAAVFMAAEAAEAAGSLYRLSNETGISVENLSALSFLGKQVGIDVENMARSLDRVSRSAVKAAEGPEGAVNAYTRLGIAVKNTDGTLRDVNSIFSDVVDKLSSMAKGAERTASAQDIFGRTGAKMLTALDDVDGGLEAVKKQAASYNALISTDTAKASEEFERNLKKVGIAADGISNEFLTALLPTIKIVSEQLIAGMKAVLPIIQEYMPEIKGLVKAFIILGDLVVTVFKQIYDIVIGVFEQIGNAEIRLYASVKALTKGHLSEAGAAWDGFGSQARASMNRFLDNSKKDWTDFAAFTKKVIYGSDEIPKPDKPRAGHRDTGAGAADKEFERIKLQVENVKALAEAELRLAAAASESASAQLLTKAAGEADVFIKKLESEAARTTGKEHEKLTGYINANRTSIIAWYKERAVAAESVKLNEQLDKETLAFTRQIEALRSSADAYREGGEAIVKAQVAAAVAKDRQEVEKLTESFDLLAKTPGVTADALAKEQAALDAATAKMREHETQERAVISAKLDEQVAKQTSALNAEAAAFDITAAAALKSAAAQREAAASAAATKFGAENPGADAATIRAVHDNTLKAQERAYQQTVLTIAAQHDLNKQYDDQLTKLEAARDVLIANRQSTLLIDEAIYNEQNKLNKQWDDAAIKMGGFKDKVTGVLDEIRMEGENMWGSIAEAGKKALDNLTNELAKFAVTGKGSFKQVWQGLEESITQAGIKKLESSLAGGLMNMLGLGSATKPDGSKSNPFFVSNVDAMGGEAGGGGLFGSIQNMFGGSSGEDGGGGIGGFLSGIVGKIGSVFGSIGSFFGGFLAQGGDVTPGKAYVVGEHHPEFFVPNRQGSVVPALKMGGEHTTHLSVHFHGIQDMDSFKKSQSQIVSAFHRQAAIAYQRGA